MSEPAIELGSLAQLVDAVELTAAFLIELHAIRVPEREVDLDGLQIGIAQEISFDAVVLSFRAQVEAADADLTAAVQMRYSFIDTSAGPYTIPEPILREFIEKVGVMAGYPYLRQAIFGLASSLTIAPVVLGLLRPGMVSLSEDRPDSDND